MYELVLLRAGSVSFDGQIYTLEQLQNIADNLASNWLVIELCDYDKDIPVSARVIRAYVEGSLLKMEIAIDE